MTYREISDRRFNIMTQRLTTWLPGDQLLAADVNDEFNNVVDAINTLGLEVGLTPSSVIHIDEVNGRVGIGTTSENGKLSINGTGAQRDDGWFAQIELRDNISEAPAIIFSNISNGGYAGISFNTSTAGDDPTKELAVIAVARDDVGRSQIYFAVNPTIGVTTCNIPMVLWDDGSVECLGTTAITIPTGTTAQAPAAANGMLRYNTTTNKLQAVINGTWRDVTTS